MAWEQWFWRGWVAVGGCLLTILPLGGLRAGWELSEVSRRLDQHAAPTEAVLREALAPALAQVRAGAILWMVGLFVVTLGLGMLRWRFARRLTSGRPSEYSYGLSLLFCLLLGQVCGHRLYLGRWGSAAIYLGLLALVILSLRWPHPLAWLLCSLGLPTLVLWHAIDLVRIADERFRDNRGARVVIRANRPVQPAEGPRAGLL